MDFTHDHISELVIYSNSIVSADAPLNYFLAVCLPCCRHKSSLLLAFVYRPTPAEYGMNILVAKVFTTCYAIMINK